MFLVRDSPSERRSRRGPEESTRESDPQKSGIVTPLESSVRKPSLICGHLETGLLPNDELLFLSSFFPTLFLQFFWGGSIFCFFLLKWWFVVDRQKLPSGLLGIK